MLLRPLGHLDVFFTASDRAVTSNLAALVRDDLDDGAEGARARRHLELGVGELGAADDGIHAIANPAAGEEQRGGDNKQTANGALARPGDYSCCVGGVVFKVKNYDIGPRCRPADEVAVAMVEESGNVSGTAWIRAVGGIGLLGMNQGR
jgi:hypothetical protein